MNKKSLLSILIVVALCFLAWHVPAWTGAFDLTFPQQILLVIFVGAAFLWILEPIPVYGTSLLLMAAIVFLLSDSAFGPVKDAILESDKDHLLKYKSVLASFSAPVLILFLGGFCLASGATKYKLDLNLARILLKPFGTQPKYVMLGMMSVTALFSMFMSNTATTVMMLAMVTPLLQFMDTNDRGIKGLIIGIPFAANIGGIGTPIGSPPNAIALGYLTGADHIDFLTWMMYGTPLMVVLVLAAWLLLLALFPFEEKKIEIKIESSFGQDFHSWVVYITFGVTVLLWITEKWHGINANAVALVPMFSFCCFKVMKPHDIRSLSWDVIWLVAGGIALGDALGKTGLASVLANAVDYAAFSPFVILLLVCLVSWVLTNFISNTAAANLMIPIAFALLTTLKETNGIDIDIPIYLMVVALTMSFGMSLPISTPPNSLAYASGLITSHEIMKTGTPVGAMCLILALIIAFFFA